MKEKFSSMLILIKNLSNRKKVLYCLLLVVILGSASLVYCNSTGKLDNLITRVWNKEPAKIENKYDGVVKSSVTNKDNRLYAVDVKDISKLGVSNKDVNNTTLTLVALKLDSANDKEQSKKDSTSFTVVEIPEGKTLKDVVPNGIVISDSAKIKDIHFNQVSVELTPDSIENLMKALASSGDYKLIVVKNS